MKLNYIKMLRDELGVTQEKIAEVLGIEKARVVDWERGKVRVPAEILTQLMEEYQLDGSWILSGEGIAKKHDISSDLAIIPWIDAVASAGNGSIVVNAKVKDVIGLSPSWLWENFHLYPSEVVAMSVDGQSMEPTIKNGDIILFKKTDDGQIMDGICVIRFEGTILIKHLQKLSGGKIKIISEHPSYAPQEVDLNDTSIDFEVIGRVVWFGRKI